MVKLILSITLAIAATLVAQGSEFSVHLSRWTNHDYPEPMKSALPLAPADAKRDGVLAIVTTTGDHAAIEATLTYRRDGKRFRESRTVETATTGCTPEPCRWAPVLFEVGAVDMATVSVSVQPWSLKDE